MFVNTVSPSRTYVAMICKPGFSGYKFAKFYLPILNPNSKDNFVNNAGTATWYYLNYIDLTSCIEGCISFEEFSDCKEIPPDKNLISQDEKYRLDEAIKAVKAVAEKHALDD